MTFFKRLFTKVCKHHFKAKEMGSRDETGYLKWPCSKCKKVFYEECGLDVLRNGTCDGNWGSN